MDKLRFFPRNIWVANPVPLVWGTFLEMGSQNGHFPGNGVPEWTLSWKVAQVQMGYLFFKVMIFSTILSFAQCGACLLSTRSECGREESEEGAVSYTHLTLPTNREV